MKKNNMDIVFILDRSGSMSGSEEDVIGGFNRYLEDNKDLDVKVTTVLFDDKYELLHYRKDIKDVNKLDNGTYFVRGCTALFDAIGKTIEKLDNDKVKHKVLFIITTDGLENASSKYHKKDIINLIHKHENYEFIYLGANIDSYAEGQDLGISRNNIATFEKSADGVDKMFGSISNLSRMVYCEESISEEWKKELK